MSEDNTINNQEEDNDDTLILTDEVAVEDSEENSEIELEEQLVKEKTSNDYILTQRTKFYADTNKADNSEGASIAVVGSGTIGGLITGLFMRSGNKVSCFSSPSSCKRILAEGISVNSLVYDDFSFRPEIAYLIKKKPEIILITTRATHINIAMTALHKKRIDDSIIIVLTAGFEYLKNLKNDYGFSVSVGFVEPFEAYREDVNRIVHKAKKLKITVANDKTIEREKLEKVADRFKLAGIDFKVVDNVVDLIWLKMASLCAISLISGASREPFKQAIKDKKWFNIMEKIIWETLKVAKRENSNISYDDVIKIINDVPSNYKPPLLLDVEKGQIGEIDALASSIARLGDRYEILCPTIKKLVGDIIKNAPKYYEVRILPYL